MAGITVRSIATFASVFYTGVCASSYVCCISKLCHECETDI